MDIPVLLPIDGVPDELLRALNERFRQLSQDAPATTSVAATANQTTPPAAPAPGWTKVSTTAPALTAPVALVSGVGGSAGTTYNSTVQGLINALITYSTNMATLTTNLRTRVLELEAQVKALGFTR